jgi:ubiquitin-like-conjugating enzyme ATG10
MDIQNFPYLNAEEFSETCHLLDRRYRQAILGSVRRTWKLRVCTALDISFSSDAEYTTYIQITRPLETVLDHGDLSAQIENLSFGERSLDDIPAEDTDMTIAEDADEVFRTS